MHGKWKTTEEAGIKEEEEESKEKFINKSFIILHHKNCHLNPTKISHVVPRKNITKSDENEDLISLNAFGYSTQWRFPENLKRCPTCWSQCKTRPRAIAHYKKRHAMQAILCCLCDKPISCKWSTTPFSSHYKQMHPNIVDPFNFEGNAKLMKKRIIKRKKARFQLNFLLYS